MKLSHLLAALALAAALALVHVQQAAYDGLPPAGSCCLLDPVMFLDDGGECVYVVAGWAEARECRVIEVPPVGNP